MRVVLAVPGIMRQFLECANGLFCTHDFLFDLDDLLLSFPKQVFRIEDQFMYIHRLRRSHHFTTLPKGIERLALAAESSVHLSEHDVEGADDRDYVGHQQAAHHLVEGLQIHVRRRTHADAVRLRGTVADDEISQFAFGGFYGVIDLAHRRLDYLRHLGHDRPLRQTRHRLTNNADRLAHLLD